VVRSGSFTMSVQNRLPIASSIDMRLDGVTRGGVPLTSTLVIPAAPGDGTSRTGSVTLDLAGAVIIPARVVVAVSGSASAASATITSANATDAVVVDGGGSLVIESVAGRLDPALTPELTVSMEEFNEVERSSVDFGDLEDAVRGSRINDATAQIAIRNSALTPLKLSNVRLGVVRLDAGGQPLRDAGGRPAWERDSATSQPILVTLAQPGDTTLVLARASTTSLSLQFAPLVNRLVHLVLDSVRCAVVASGSAVAGDGSQSRFTRNDSAKVSLQLLVGLDITLPDTGVVFTRTEYVDGADVDPADSALVVSRLVAGSAITDVTNGTPFGISVELSIARDSVAADRIFAAPGRVDLGPIVIAASPVDAAGRVTTPATSSQSVSLSGTQAVVLLGKRFTTGVRIRLRPPPGGGLRGAIRPTDEVLLRSHASVELRAGGGQ